jgi:hypothetical protein
MDASVMNEIQRASQYNVGLAKYQLDFEDLITRIEYILRGVKRDADSGELIQLYEPILNDRGRTVLVSNLNIWLTKITAQSNYDEQEIRAWCRVTWARFCGDLYSYAPYWELKSDNLTSVLQIMTFALHSIMKCALNGGLRTEIGQSHKSVVSETYNTGPNQQPKKMGL